MEVNNQKPGDREQTPRGKERQGEQYQMPTPLHINQGCEDINQVAKVALGNIPSSDVRLSFLLDESLRFVTKVAEAKLSPNGRHFCRHFDGVGIVERWRVTIVDVYNIYMYSRDVDDGWQVAVNPL